MIVQKLQRIFDKSEGELLLYRRNLLKEAIQQYVLNYIYNSDYGNQYIFKGGTCLRFCYDLPRLSEDLDFDVLGFDEFSLNELIENLEAFFSQKLQFKEIEIKTGGHNDIVYLRFPVLDKIGFPIEKPSDAILFIRLDISPARGQSYETQITLKSSSDFSFLIKHYSLKDLMAGKLAAILERETKEDERTRPRFKGRDYYDLFWFIEQGVVPNMTYLFEITSFDNKAAVIAALEDKVDKAVDRKKMIQDDLYPFFENQRFVSTFVEHLDQLKPRVRALKAGA